MIKILKELAIAVTLTTFIFLFFASYYLISNGKLSLNFFATKGTIIGISYGIVLYFVNNLIGKYIQKKFPADNNIKQFLFIFIPSNIVCTSLCIFTINYIVSVLVFKEAWINFINVQSLDSYIIICTLSLLIALLFFALSYYKRRKNAEILFQERIAGQATAHFESLKAQIDPHFLFNSLNVLASLIEEDSQKAIDYTHSLSAIYRYITAHKDQRLIALSQELAFADSYISLIRIRFEDAIVYQDSVISSDSSYYVAPLSLQLLLENAIQHNLATEESMLTIRIWTKDNYLIVENNLQEKTIKPKSTHVGLRNIQQRYALLTNHPVVIEKTDKHFRVKIPLLSNP